MSCEMRTFVTPVPKSKNLYFAFFRMTQLQRAVCLVYALAQCDFLSYWWWWCLSGAVVEKEFASALKAVSRGQFAMSRRSCVSWLQTRSTAKNQTAARFRWAIAGFRCLTAAAYCLTLGLPNAAGVALKDKCVGRGFVSAPRARVRAVAMGIHVLMGNTLRLVASVAACAPSAPPETIVAMPASVLVASARVAAGVAVEAAALRFRRSHAAKRVGRALIVDLPQTPVVMARAPVELALRVTSEIAALMGNASAMERRAPMGAAMGRRANAKRPALSLAELPARPAWPVMFLRRINASMETANVEQRVPAALSESSASRERVSAQARRAPMGAVPVSRVSARRRARRAAVRPVLHVRCVTHQRLTSVPMEAAYAAALARPVMPTKNVSAVNVSAIPPRVLLVVATAINASLHQRPRNAVPRGPHVSFAMSCVQISAPTEVVCVVPRALNVLQASNVSGVNASATAPRAKVGAAILTNA